MPEPSLQNKKDLAKEKHSVDFEIEKPKPTEVPEKKEGREDVAVKRHDQRPEEEKPSQEKDQPGLAAPQIQKPQVSAVPPKSETLIKIEKILSEDLEDIYASLDKPTQQRFKQAGEETAHQIDEILHSVKIKIKEIIKLIIEWLKILPGVNKFFIKKQAKIKTEKILELAPKDKQK